MAQPTAYTRQYNFNDFSVSNPNDQQPGSQLDAEFNAVRQTLVGTLANLALIQRDDGAIKNGVVTKDSFDATARALMAGSWTPRGAWVTATVYAVSDVVSEAGAGYVCATAHTAGTFSTDLTAVKWIPLSLEASAFAKTLLDDADASTARATLGISSFAGTLLDDTTAAAARGTLGSTAVGDAVFVAASAAAARTAIGVSGGWQLIGSVTAGASAAADFEQASIGDGTYSTLMLVLSRMRPATDGDSPWLRLKKAGAFDAGTGYATWVGGGISASAGYGTADVNTTNKALLSFTTVGNVDGQEPYSGVVVIAAPHIAKAHFLHFQATHGNQGGNLVAVVGSSLHNPTNVIQGVRFMFSTGNIADGVAHLFGLRTA